MKKMWWKWPSILTKWVIISNERVFERDHNPFMYQKQAKALLETLHSILTVVI